MARPYAKRRKTKIMDAREMGRKGGLSRAKRLSAERRREIALQGGQASKEAAARKKTAKKKSGGKPDGYVNSKLVCDTLGTRKDSGGK